MKLDWKIPGGLMKRIGNVKGGSNHFQHLLGTVNE